MTPYQSFRPKQSALHSFKERCALSCRKVLDQLSRVRERIFEEGRRSVQEQAHLVHLAVNEAESLAWQTGFPHLVFPTLASEKVEEVIAWTAHQEAVRKSSSVLEPAVLGSAA